MIEFPTWFGILGWMPYLLGLVCIIIVIKNWHEDSF